MSDRRRLVLVVGVGRSGTSLLAGILGQVGFHIPQPEVVADSTNPRGFGEPRWVVDFHTRLMRRARVTVFDARPAAWQKTRAFAENAEVQTELRDWVANEMRHSDDVVVKDPRVGWFLPLWLSAARELALSTSFITMLRHPAEILASARRSYGDWQTDASRAASWLNVMLESERATREAPRAFIRYEGLMSDWSREIGRVGETVDLPLLTGFDRARFPEVDQFVDPSLHRNRGGWDGLEVPAPVRTMADDVWTALQPLADPGDGEQQARPALDAARVAYDGLYGEAEAIAQSSVTAVRPRRKQQQPAQNGRVSLRVRVARRIPARYRRRIRSALGRSS